MMWGMSLFSEGRMMNNHTVEALLEEKRVFPPPQKFQKQANVNSATIYEEAAENPEAFWGRCAEELVWMQPWTRVLDWQPPYAIWFHEGKLNVSVNCLDRHLASANRNKAALIWEGEPGEARTWTYQQLHREVCKLANGLKELGVKKGDRVAIYLPMVPEAIASMLACARIGAVHTVVFAGFSSEALRDRIQDCEASVLITADGGYRRGAQIPLKVLADRAVEECHTIRKVVVLRRTQGQINMKHGRDEWYHDLISQQSASCDPEPMDSEDPLFILYTSGTTDKPKGIIHTTAGYLLGVHMTTKWVFDVKPEDLFWCTADIGWVTGHSYIAYGPLSNGVSTFLYEGAPDWPARDRFWELIEKYRITIFYTAPTAIRTFMRWGREWPEGRDLTSLRLLGTVGEPINPEAWMWYHTHVGRSKCPVVDTWWQTETGCILIAPLPGITPLKPGSATKPLPGIEAAVLNEEGQQVSAGLLAITAPWPAMLRGIYKDPQRYLSMYWKKWKGRYYFTGDGAKCDDQGYFWLLGRVDDVMNVAGHRIGTMEVESALVDHPLVAEAAVIGVLDDVKGQAIIAFVTLKERAFPGGDFESELKEHVVEKIGSLARPKKIVFTRDLPKTRSGKIMRRLLRDIGEGRVLGDVSTLADASIIEELKTKYEED
jgi:acetyl-CoA synthetase